MSEQFMVGGNKPYLEGSKQFQCFYCSADCFVSKSGQNLIKQKSVEGKVEVICLTCALKEMEKRQVKDFEELNCEQIKELKDNI